MRIASWLTCLVLLPSAGCFLGRSAVNEPLAAERIARITPGSTTAAEVADLLGAPTEVVQLGKRMAWRYDFSIEKTAGFSVIVLTLINRDTRADRAWLFFDENDVLRFAGSSLEAQGAQYALPWQDVYGEQ